MADAAALRDAGNRFRANSYDLGEADARLGRTVYRRGHFYEVRLWLLRSG